MDTGILNKSKPINYHGETICALLQNIIYMSPNSHEIAYFWKTL